MTDGTSLAEAKARVAAAHASAADVAWLDGIGWSDMRVGPVENAAQVADYQRREALLNAAVAHLTFAERAASPEGRIAAMLGAALADWRDKKSGDDD